MSFQYSAWPVDLYAHPVLRILIPTLLGAASALAMAPFNWIVVLFITLSGLYALVLQASGTKQAFVTGWLFGFGYHIAGLYWIANALLVEGNPYSWAWPLAAVGLPAVLGVYLGLATLLAWRLTILKTISGYLVFCLALFSAEYLRGHIFTGFPWNLPGYGWGGVWPIVQTVELIGIYGLTLLTILWCSLPAFLWLGDTLRITKCLLGAAAILSLGMSYGYGAYQLKQPAQPAGKTDAVNFVLIQPNIAQHKKWRRDNLRENFRRHLDPSYYTSSTDIAPEATTYIVWPETALAYFHLNHAGTRNQIRDMLQSYPGKAYLISGALLRPGDKTNAHPQYANAIVALNQRGRIIKRYKKSHLVPFGEYIPFKEWIPLQPVAEFNNLIAGEGPEPTNIGGNHKFYPLICYEVIFPGLLDSVNARTNFIMNVTNDAWYGRSAGPYQHFMQARFRAVENNKPLIRAANTGISGVIDSRGRVMAKTSIFTADKFHLKLP